MEGLIVVVTLMSMLTLVSLHCWSLSALFSYRFGILRGLAWILPLVLLPFIGPLIFIFSTRRFRELNRPTRKRAAAWFITVFTLFLAGSMYICIEQYNHFSRRSADAEATTEMTNVRALIREHIEKTGNSRENLQELGLSPNKPVIRVLYKKVGPDGFELKAWHDKGESDMQASHRNNDIERMPMDKPR